MALRRTESGLGSSGGPTSPPSVIIRDFSFGQGSDRSFELEEYLEPSMNKKIVLIKTLHTKKIKVPKSLRPYRVTLGIDSLPQNPSSQFLDQFFEAKKFVYFDLRNEGGIIEEIIDTVMRFSAIVPTVLIVVYSNSFGKGIESSLIIRSALPDRIKTDIH